MVIAKAERLFLRCFHVGDLDAMMDVYGRRGLRIDLNPRFRHFADTGNAKEVRLAGTTAFLACPDWRLK